MNIKFTLFLIILCMGIINYPLFSQNPNGKIHGQLLSADNIPVENASVSLKHTNKFTTSDKNGFFTLNNLSELNDTLVIKCVNKETLNKIITLKEGETLDLGIIKLQEKLFELKDIEVIENRENTYKTDYSSFATKTEMKIIDIPQSISIVTDKLIEDKMQYSLKDITSNVSGVNHYSGFDEYSIRGFRAENARTINGLRGYNSTYTSSMLLNIKQVEIIKGPASSLYGNGDPGGSINMVTKKPQEELYAQISITGGSWNHGRIQGDITGPLTKNKKILYRLNAGYDNTKSFRNQYFAKSYQIAPSFTFKPLNNLHLNLDFSVSNINTILDRGQPGYENDLTLNNTPTNLIISQPEDYLKETDIASIFRLTYDINNHISFYSGYLNYVTRQKVAEHGFHNYITTDSINLYYNTWDYNTITNSLTNYLNFRFKTGIVHHSFLIGYDYIRSNVDITQNSYELPRQFGHESGIVGTFSLRNPQYISRPVGLYQISDFDNEENEVDGEMYHTQGIYIQELLTIGKLKLIAGLRMEFYRGEDDEHGDDDNEEEPELSQKVLLPKIGVTYSILPELSIYASYNKGFDPFEATNQHQVFNSDFKPIVSELYEAGIKTLLLNNKLSASLAFYNLTVKNVAVNANDPSNPDLYVQRGEEQSKGIELEVNGNILKNLAVNISYAYNIAKITRSEIPKEIGNIKENAPKNSSNSWIMYYIEKGYLKGLSFAAGHSQVSRRNTLDREFDLPGYFIFNAGIQYSLKNFSIAFHVNNILNKTYWTSAYNNIYKWPGLPRNYLAKISYSFNKN